MTAAEGGGIFVSYRRQETAHLAGRLYDRLADRFGEGQVFIDVDAIEPGVDFAEEIFRAVAACTVLLAVIGPGWLTAADERGRRRLDDPSDFVRLEIEAALSRGVRVIPVLAEGAVMPAREDLPGSLAGLAHLNALWIRHESFEADAGRLVAAIERVMAARGTDTAAHPAARPLIRKGAAYTGTVIALLGGIAGIIGQVLDHGSGQTGVNYFFRLAIFSVLVVVAVIALLQIYRLVITGFIQGISWLSVPSLAAYIVILGHLSGATGRFLVAPFVTFASFALGVIAAILLMVSWRPAADRSPAPQIRTLPMILLGAMGFSQIAALIFYVTAGQTFTSTSVSYVQAFYYILGSFGVLAALAVTWYAMSLRARALGGALVLGWVTVTALQSCIFMTEFWSQTSSVGRVCVVLNFVLLATVVMLTIIYVRRPSEPESSANQQV